MDRPKTSPGTDRTLGFVLVAISAVLWSTAGLFVRMAGLDPWTVLGWRSLASAVFLAAFFAMRSRRRAGAALRRLGWPDLFQIATSLIATIAYVFALELTSVANVMTVYATLPFVAAGIAFVWVGERVDARLLVAGAVALAGVALMAGAAMTARDIAGNLAAFATTVGFGLQLVHVKRHPGADMPLIMAVAAGLCAILSWPLMAATLPSPSQIGAMAAFGILTTGIGYILALEGGRRIGSGEAGIVSMLDVVLGPLWVWLAFAEVPSRAVLLGGTLVLGSVLWYLWRSREGATAVSP
ncbi:DMT family transporter [Lichenihabitans sp. Uapishka_5]|uniref:DMT family transporter n=1 Tax=Lichenihabitans sp. Uapishka_5 TaxID=3037302 RepID=UPI0029E80ECB|nr:DMT family transporter [Lichenihabitans sp. Uapishka_5]MDX7950925.1 DMT family transporter [Lichenihabitans sp. Uapishka_5]